MNRFELRLCHWQTAVCAAALVLLTLSGVSHAFTVNVSGNLQWRDGQNNLHNARGVKMELWSIDFFGAQTKEFTANANMDGNYSGSFESVAPGLLSVYLKIFAENSAGYVTSSWDANKVPTPAGLHGLQTATSGVGAGNNFLNADFSNAIDAGQAFGVLDMMLVGAQYTNDVRNAALAALPARFPHSATAADKFPDMSPVPNTSFYFNNNIYILSKDRWDPDVIGHEYSHYLHDKDLLVDSPGGNHVLGTSNIPGTATNANGQKSRGIRLAWGEGIGNYMGVGMQSLNAAANKFPTNYANFGDTSYTDTLDSTNDYNLETTAGSGMAGEGEEVAVSRILWDIADGKNELHDRIERGQKQVYQDLLAVRDDLAFTSGDPASRVATLNQVNDYYINTVSTNDVERTDYGSIFETYSVSPHPIGSLIGDLVDISNPVTFEWERRNNNANDTFQLIVWNFDMSERLIDFAIPGDVTSYSLTAAQKHQLKPKGGAQYSFAIIGSDLLDKNKNAYAGIESTGNYWSGAYAFAAVPEPATLGLVGPMIALWLRKRKRTPCGRFG